jgi:hypothetical protein
MVMIKYLILFLLTAGALALPMLSIGNRDQIYIFIISSVSLPLAYFLIEKIRFKFWMIIPLSFLYAVISIILFIVLSQNFSNLNDIDQEYQAMGLWKYLYLIHVGLIPCSHIILKLHEYLNNKRYIFMIINLIFGILLCFAAVSYWLVNYSK